MTTDAQALAIAVRALPQEPRAALHIALAVARAETHYSDNWGPNVMPGGGNPNNWGAVHATEVGKPAFAHLDHHADGTPYMAAFTINPTPEAGFKQIALYVLKPNVVAAAESGDGKAAVHAMHANGYFELDPEQYAASVEKQYAAFLAATGEPRLLSFDGPAPAQDAPENAAPSSGQGINWLEVLAGAALVWGAKELADLLAAPKPTPKAKPK